MNIRGKQISFKQLLCLILYYAFSRHLPCSNKIFNFGGVIRLFLCKRIFRYCGNEVNIEHGAVFGADTEIQTGDNSGLGIHCCVPNGTVIGKNVIMGPNCYILAQNHSFDRLDIPMCKQGFSPKKYTIIGDDVWIGRNVLMTPGRTIANGSIIAGGCVLCKDFPEFSIVGGNPSKLIKSRI